MKKKSEKIEEVKKLLNGGTEKQSVCICDTFDCEPGYYRYDGRIIDEIELEELKKDYDNTIIFILKEQKDIQGKARIINVLSNESAEKLKDFLTE